MRFFHGFPHLDMRTTAIELRRNHEYGVCCRVESFVDVKKRNATKRRSRLYEYPNYDIRVHVIECQQFPICQSVCRWRKAEIVTITEFQNYILNIVEF